MRCCLFCRVVLTRATRSKEHVIPGWLLDHLGIRQQPTQPSVLASGGKDRLVQRDLTYDGFRAGRVCGCCNKGWMSKLEEASKPILVRLMSGELQPTCLCVAEQLVLGRWAAKTAYALSSTSDRFNTRIPPSHPVILRESAQALPPNVAVFAHQLPLAHDRWQRPTWLCSASAFRYDIAGRRPAEQEIKRLHHSSYKICLQFQRLLLLVASWSEAHWIPVYWRGIHQPIVPHPELAHYNRAAAEFPDHDGLARLASHTSLAVAHKSVVHAVDCLPAPPPVWLDLPPELWNFVTPR